LLWRLGTFTNLASHAPWSPVMDAWTGAPIPSEIRERTLAASDPGSARLPVEAVPQLPRARRNTVVSEGPALDAVAVRLTGDQLVRQVLQGGGNMPAYGKNLNPAETTALVAFLESLHPSGQAPASDASRTAEFIRDLPDRVARRWTGGGVDCCRVASRRTSIIICSPPIWCSIFF